MLREELAPGQELVPDDQKEVCAILCMRMMLEDYSDSRGIAFESVFEDFASSETYNRLFDFDTHLWAESPDYLALLFEEEKGH